MSWPKTSPLSRTLAFLLVLLLFPSGVPALDNTARSALTTWVDQHNNSPQKELRSYIESTFADAFLQQVSVEQMLATHQQFQEFGALELDRVELEIPNAIVALLRSEKGTWFRIQLATEGNPPKITGLRLDPAQPPKELSSDWKTLDELAENLVEETGMPGIALAWARPGEVPRGGVAGVRKISKRRKVETEDRFHIGSVTKSVTATVLGSLVEKGKLRWNSKLSELLPDVEMHPVFAEVELQQLLRHRGRIPQHMTFGEAEMNRLNGLPGSPTEQRAAYAAEVLALEPLDEGYFYSNAGYSIAGHIAERVSRRSWEQLVQEEVFTPLGLDTCGVGWPATSERSDQPRGHLGLGDNLQPLELDDTSLGAFMRPAGDLHCSAADLARYGLAHLAGLEGQDGVLKSTTIRELHRAEGTEPAYAAGWVIDPETGQHHHNGTVGSFYSHLVVDPEAKMVVVFLANAGPQQGRPASLHAAEQILERFAAP